MIRQEKLKSWEEPLAVEEDLFEVDYTPPSNILNADQERELGEIKAGSMRAFSHAGLLYGVTGSGKTEVYLGAVEAALARGQNGADSGAGNRADAVGAAAVPRAVRGRAWPCCTARCRKWSARANGGACGAARRASWWARARRCSRRSKMWA